jgi:hypothetical protein
MRLFSPKHEPRQGSPLLGGIFFLLTIAVAGYFWFQYTAAMQKQRISYLENIGSRLRSETVPVKFMILSREGGEIKARLKLYDLSGREVAVIEKSWPGSVLYVDMLLVPVRGGPAPSAGSGAQLAEAWLAFPYRIFTDRLDAASGTLLFDSYESAGFPDVLGGVEWSSTERAGLIKLFSAARRKAAAGLPASDSAKGAFGSAVHEAAQLSSFQVGTAYKVVCRVKGGVEIAED